MTTTPEKQTRPIFRNADSAFNDAIDAGRLSINPTARNYAGDYMYMGTYGNRDAFKNRDTRDYDV